MLLAGLNTGAQSETEPTASPNPKDDVEFRLIQLVCRRQVALADAQAAIAGDWTTALAALGQS